MALESIPSSLRKSEDVSSVVPVALVPGPALSSVSGLGWAPVVPLAVVPSVPDFLSDNPLPSD